MIPSMVMGLTEPRDIIFDIILASRGYNKENEARGASERDSTTIGAKISSKRQKWDRSALDGWVKQ